MTTHSFRIVRVLEVALVSFVTVAAFGQSPQPASFVWTVGVPEEQGVDSRPLNQMFARITSQNLPIDGFILVRNGTIVAERYFGGYGPDTQHPMYSVTKSFTATALGIAIDRGLVSGVDASALSFFPDMTVQNLTLNKQHMRVRHLLTMATGHTTDTTNSITVTNDWVQAFFDLPLPEEPGTRFLYNSGASVVLSAIVQARAGMNTEAFARQTYLGPMGVTNFTWDQGPNALSIGGWGLWLTPRDMAKAGLLWLNRGKWQGSRLVSASWIAESSRKQIANGTTGYWGVGYGYQFWLNPFGGFRADGYAGQLIFVLPDQNVVAVFTSRPTGAAVPEAFNLMSDYVLPAIGASALAHLAEGGPPVILSQPVPVVAAPGGDALFAVRAVGPGISYQWTHDGAPVPGANGRTLRLPAVSAADGGAYRVEVTGPGGSVSSDAAGLTVGAARAGGRLVALSAQAEASGGARSLVVGVAVAGGDGSAGVPVLLRGVGPSLANFGVSNVMADPAIALFSGGSEVSRCDDWDGDAVVAATAARLGEFPLGAGSWDAATVAALRPGTHTLVAGPLSPDQSGTVLAECYDATVKAAADAPELVGLSARGQVGIGGVALTGGFVLEGSGPQTVLLRAVGPGLAAYGVTGTLSDPVLTLYAAGEARASNDDWAGGPELAAAFQRVGEFALSPDSKDAALLVDLDPGVYTAVVTGKGGASGIALLEIYPVR